jgi:hypothetical protein
VRRATSQMCAHRQSQSRTRQPPGSLRYSERLNGGRTGHLAIIRMRGPLGQRLVGRRVALRAQPRPVARLEEKENPEPRASEDTERAEEPPRVLREAEKATAGQREAAIRELHGQNLTVDSWVWATLPPARRPVVGGPQRCWRAWKEIGASPMWVSVLREGLWAPVDAGFDVSAVRWGSALAKTREQRR